MEQLSKIDGMVKIKKFVIFISDVGMGHIIKICGEGNIEKQ